MPLIDPIRLIPLLGPVAGRLDVDSVATCDSTNTRLMDKAGQGAPSGTVLVADGQTAGRGRRGRVWASSPEDSLTFSLLWRLPPPATRVSGLSLAVGLALSQGLAALGAQGVRLKWPNDLLWVHGVQEAKLAGILIELAMDRRGTQAVIGVGLNLKAPAESVGQPAAGLVDALPPLPDRHLILATLLTHLVATLDTFTASGFAPLRAAWESQHAWQGRPVRVLDEGVAQSEGLCLGADDDGALLIQTAAGPQRVLAGEISVRAVS